MVIEVTPVRSPDYYIDQVARDRHDYLTGEGEASGRWEGTWAPILGVAGEVTEPGFRAMFAERHPVTGEKLKKHANKRVAGWDITFSPPKSISALWAIAPDDIAEEVREALRVARRVGVAQFERYACVARLGRNGIDRQPGLGFWWRPLSIGCPGTATRSCTTTKSPPTSSRQRTDAAPHSTGPYCTAGRPPPTPSARPRCAPS